MDDDKFNSLCEAHSFGAVARGEFPLMPRGLLKALVDAAVVAERERCAALADSMRIGMPGHTAPHPVFLYRGDVGEMIRGA